MRNSFKRSMRVFCAFICGQMTETMVFIIAFATGVNKVIPWACAAGFLLSVAVFAGRYIAIREVNDEAVQLGTRGK